VTPPQAAITRRSYKKEIRGLSKERRRAFFERTGRPKGRGEVYVRRLCGDLGKKGVTSYRRKRTQRGKDEGQEVED